jgi:BirA family biotin operon repressor/biotin-[acetyl-CoA-carboxylase] ligase
MGPLERPARATDVPVDGLEVRWAPGALRERLQELCPGLIVEIVGEVGSTNVVLLSDLRASAAGAWQAPRLLVAERQTSGRGRLGRAWHAQPEASLTFSLAMSPSRPDLSGLSLAVGVAIARALDRAPTLEGARIALKWPNDLWLRDPSAEGGGRKLGGILIETIGSGAQRWVVIGVGLNILRQSAGDFATGQAWLREIDPVATPASTLPQVAAALLTALVAFERRGLEAFMEGFRERDLLQGRQVTTTLPTIAEGLAEGIDPLGHLQVRHADGRLHLVASGEVSVRPARSTTGCANRSARAGQAGLPC